MNKQLKYLLSGGALVLSSLVCMNAYSTWMYNNYTGRYVWVTPHYNPNYNYQNRRSRKNPCSIYEGTLISAVIARNSGCNSSQVNRAASRSDKMFKDSIDTMMEHIGGR